MRTPCASCTAPASHVEPEQAATMQLPAAVPADVNPWTVKTVPDTPETVSPEFKGAASHSCPVADSSQKEKPAETSSGGLSLSVIVCGDDVQLSGVVHASPSSFGVPAT